jgi:hypothetical protein
LWTKPFPGTNCEQWVIPVGKIINGPRHIAEQLTNARYHVLVMDEKRIAESDGQTEMFGVMVAKNTKNRLDATPISNNKSIFMGSTPQRLIGVV